MPVEIRVPPLGESLIDAVVGTWLKSEGDSVSRGETLVELETDKVNLDVAATEDGVLARIEKQPGDVVTVGELLGIVGDSNGVVGAPVGLAAAPAPIAASAPAPVIPAAAPAPITAAAPAPPIDAADGSGRAAPAVKRLAEEHALDINKVPGSGPSGRVTREDVLAFAAKGQVNVPPMTIPAAPAPIIAAAPSPAPQPPVAPAPTTRYRWAPTSGCARPRTTRSSRRSAP